MKKTIPVIGMACVVCAANVENTLRKLRGVNSATVTLSTRTVLVDYDPDVITLDDMKREVSNAGYDLVVESDRNAEEINRREYTLLRRRTLLSWLFAALTMYFGMSGDGTFNNQICLILALLNMFYCGRRFYVLAAKQITHRTANMDSLVALSTFIAFLFSTFNTFFGEAVWGARGIEWHTYFDASVMIITFVLTGRCLEEKAKDSTASSIRQLMGMQPKTARIVTHEKMEGTDDYRMEEVPISTIQIGDTIEVRAGEKIPVDGVVCAAESFMTADAAYVDEAMISGEPTPAMKKAGDTVLAGTIPSQGKLRMRARQIGENTALAHIIRMVQEAQGSKAPVQKLADKIAGIFVPAIIGIALLSFVLWLVFDPSGGMTHGILAAVTVLVIACPCALGLATPTAVMVGIGKGAEKGILIRDAVSLETAGKIDTVVLDKTGTLTEGKPVVTDIVWANGDDRAKAVFFSLEKLSEHPLADAVVHYFAGVPTLNVERFGSLTGKGIEGTVDGVRYFAGSRRLLDEQGIVVGKELNIEAQRLSAEAKSIVWFADSEQALAVAAIADRIKESSVEAVRELQAAGIDVYMLTGDSRAAAGHIAEKAGIRHFEAEILPQDKAAFVKRLQTLGHKVAMAGDGINDSAALAQADLSIAMGGGSDIAMDVAQMTIISSDLRKIPEAIRLSKQTVRTIRQNLFWAFIYNLVGIPVAAGALYPVSGFLLNPMIAGAAMALSSVSVVANSLRLKYRR